MAATKTGIITVDFGIHAHNPGISWKAPTSAGLNIQKCPRGTVVGGGGGGGGGEREEKKRVFEEHMHLSI